MLATVAAVDTVSSHPLQASRLDRSFRSDVLKGLSQRPRAIPACWLYDRRGSELFEAITTAPEYYPTRSERTIPALVPA